MLALLDAHAAWSRNTPAASSRTPASAATVTGAYSRKLAALAPRLELERTLLSRVAAHVADVYHLCLGAAALGGSSRGEITSTKVQILTHLLVQTYEY